MKRTLVALSALVSFAMFSAVPAWAQHGGHGGGHAGGGHAGGGHAGGHVGAAHVGGGHAVGGAHMGAAPAVHVGGAHFTAGAHYAGAAHTFSAAGSHTYAAYNRGYRAGAYAPITGAYRAYAPYTGGYRGYAGTHYAAYRPFYHGYYGHGNYGYGYYRPYYRPYFFGAYAPYYDYYYPYYYPFDYASALAYFSPYYGGFGASAYPLVAAAGDYYAPAVDSAQPAVAPTADQSSPPPPDDAAHFQLTVPENAEVFVDGVKTVETGTVREFATPKLNPGSRYTYKMTVRYVNAQGKLVEDSRDINFQANDWFGIDFTRPPPAQPLPTPAPPKAIQGP